MYIVLKLLAHLPGANELMPYKADVAYVIFYDLYAVDNGLFGWQIFEDLSHITYIDSNIPKQWYKKKNIIHVHQCYNDIFMTSQVKASCCLSTHWGLYKMAAISQMAFYNSFY